jgi:ketosteroid isomerase-like protein
VDPKELVRQALAELDKPGGHGFIECLTEDAEFMTPLGVMHGRDEAAAFVGGMHASFSDWKHDVEIEAIGDRVVVEGTWSGTHSGPMQTPQGEMPATGKRATVPFAGVVQVRGDEIASIHNYFDTGGFMSQLQPEPVQAGV